MRKLLFLLALFCVFCDAEVSPTTKTGATAATYMLDSASKQPLVMDFNIPLVSIKGSDLIFSLFSSRPLMIYYFSPSCPHCKNSYGGIQKIAKEYEQRGLNSIAVSVSGAGKRDVQLFMADHKASIPFFLDNGEFAKKYGDGYVPRLYLVLSDGKIIRHDDLENENRLKLVKADIEKILGIAK